MSGASSLANDKYHSKEQSPMNDHNASTASLYDTTRHSFSSSKLTIPKEFQFHLSNRKPESKSEDTLLQIQQQVMNECTFHPTTTPLPENLYALSGKLSSHEAQPFVKRVMAWKQKQESDFEQKSKQIAEMELENCTFKPQINPQLPSHSFLSSSANFGDFDDFGNGGANIHDKLYREAQKTARDKEEFSKREQEEKLRRECTFRPKITYNKRISPRVTPRYHESKKMDPRVVQNHLIEQEAECTFKPKINNVKKGRFSSGSQLYLSTDPFERLSKAAATPRKRDSLDVDTHHHTQGGASARPRSARRNSMHPQRGGGQRPQSARSARNSEVTFEQFWDRHIGREAKKKQKLEFIQQSMEPKHEPKLNKKSLNMVKSKADFLTRMEHHLAKKQDKLINKQTLPEKDCTFHPKINRVSKKMPARTVDELCHGDYQRAQKKVISKKQMIEKKKEEAHTFKPEISKNSKKYKVSSFLRIRDNPDSYIQRLKEIQDRKQSKMESMKFELESKEMAQCTFRPDTHDAPDYVKRISESMKLLNSKARQSVEPQKPDWR
mmetsp:Transcript_936/g.3219  ORF Transcript_936/g.3219 Transcript_936/m.3219 type:complete len:552 (-) Transcript_936:2646-4301(-)